MKWQTKTNIRDFFILVATALFIIVVGGAEIYWSYYTCTKKFPDVEWYICILSR